MDAFDDVEAPQSGRFRGRVWIDLRDDQLLIAPIPVFTDIVIETEPTDRLIALVLLGIPDERNRQE